MLHKSKSTRNALLKYGLSAPLFAGMMILSSASFKSNKVTEQLSVVSSDVLSLIQSEDSIKLDYQEFLKRNPVIKAVEWNTMSKVTVILKSGKREIYELNSESELKRAENLYGSFPFPPSPPPPSLLASTPQVSLDSIGGPLFSSIEVSPEPVGGLKAFFEYLSKNFKYTDEGKKNNVSGKIILAFIVETDGSLSDIKVLRGLGNGLDEEAIRVLAASSKWNPGTQKGKPVRVAYTLPFAVSAPGQKTGGTRTNNIDSLVISVAPKNILYIVDGKEESSDVLKTLDKKSIKSVNVLKGETAITLYGDKGKNGVVEIYVNATPPATTQPRIGHPGEANIRVSGSRVVIGTSKNDASRKEKTNYAATDSLIYKRVDVTLHGEESDDGLANYRGLIFLDEIEKTDKNLLKEIDPNTIGSMNVLDGKSAIKKYGKRGKDGAIEITTKKK